MTSQTAQAYDTLVLRHPKLVLVALLAVLVFFGYYTKDFRLDASADSLLLEDDAELIVAKRSRTGLEPLRRYGVGDGPTWAQPVLSGNRLFVKHGARLTLWTLR